MNKFHEIDFEHAIEAITTAAEWSDNVTNEELEMLKALLLKAKAASQPVVCPKCGSVHVGMVDHESLYLYEHPLRLAEMKDSGFGPYDTELYSTFKCFFCEEHFQKVLEVSHQ
jgi:hypothetical protein